MSRETPLLATIYNTFDYFTSTTTSVLEEGGDNEATLREENEL
jgi:hypothetical protein